MRRRPLMVGSEREIYQRELSAFDGRRPLMVGSEPDILIQIDSILGRSPSPHGRVGTPASVPPAIYKPSRRPLMVGSEHATGKPTMNG